MVSRNSLQDLCSGPEFAIGEMYAIRQFRSTTRDDGSLMLTAVMHDEAWQPGTNTAKCNASASSIPKVAYDALMEMGEEALAEAGIKLGRRQSRATEKLDHSYYPTQTVTIANPAIGAGTFISSSGKITSTYSSGTYAPGGKLVIPTEMTYGPDTYWLKHTDAIVPKPSCTCGYYAYHDLDALAENAYDADFTGVVRVHGRIVVGEKGLRAEKAEIVALVPGNYSLEAARKASALNSVSISFNLNNVSHSMMRMLSGGSVPLSPETSVFMNYLDPEVYVPDGLSASLTLYVLDGYYNRVPTGRQLLQFFMPARAETIAKHFEEYYYAYHAHKQASRDADLAASDEAFALETVKLEADNERETRESRVFIGIFAFACVSLPTLGATGNIFAGLGAGAASATAGVFGPKLLHKRARRRYDKSVARATAARDKLASLDDELKKTYEALLQCIEDSRYPVAPAPVVTPISDARQMSNFESAFKQLQLTYPSVPVFSSVEKMLQEFPLTGPDDFRNSVPED